MAEYLRKYKKKGRRGPWLRIFFVVVMLLSGLFWGAQLWLGKKVEAVIAEELGKRGLQIQYGARTWDPWRGLHLTDLAIHYRDGTPMLESENASLSFPLGQLVGRGEKISHWRVHEAKVTLYDPEGAVRLQDTTLALEARPGELVVTVAKARKDGLEVEVNGKILTVANAAGGETHPVHLSLKAVRGTLTALKVKRDTGPFRVTGSFTVDARQDGTPWTANLHGQGEKMEWQDLAVQSAQADAELSQKGSKIAAKLALEHGSSEFTLSREDWHEAPFIFSGTLKDAAGKTDNFNGSYVTESRRLAIERLKGAADLWALAQDVPALAGKLPEQVSFETFPEIDLKKVVREGGENDGHWVIGSATMNGHAKIGLKDQEMIVSGLTGAAEYDGKTWLLEDVQAKVFGGDVTITGRYQHPQLSNAQISAEALRLSDLKRWLDGDGGGSKGLLSLDYRGNVNVSEKTLEGVGSMKLDNAPVFDAPLLEQTYELFEAILPGVPRSRTGEFQADFTARSQTVDVTRFEARGGTLTVSAKGSVDLKTKRVEGTARGKLTGVKGIVTSPLSRLLEMNISGPVDDIRVKPAGPVKLASNAANGAVGAATNTVKEGGKIAATVITEGVKLPFRIFGEKGRKEEQEDDSGKR